MSPAQWPNLTFRAPHVEAQLPALSTYLGHRDPRSTYWYLSAAPELLALAAGRLHLSPGVITR